MDEPFGAVDPLNRERLQGEFARIQRELRKTVVFVTHDIDEAIRLADRIALMREGRLEQYASPEDLLDHPETKFVHDFVGADSALKRLGRTSVEEVCGRDIPVVSGPHTLDDVARHCSAGAGFVYLTDADGVLTGWVDCRVLDRGTPLENAPTRVDWREAAVTPDATLKEALSRMLGLGYRVVPVVDMVGHLIGEVSLSAIEATMSDADSNVSAPDEDG